MVPDPGLLIFLFFLMIVAVVIYRSNRHKQTKDSTGVHWVMGGDNPSMSKTDGTDGDGGGD